MRTININKTRAKKKIQKIIKQLYIKNQSKVKDINVEKHVICRLVECKDKYMKIEGKVL